MGIFQKKTWLNRISEYPNRRTITNADGSNSIVTVARNEGTVSQDGDAFNAINMNGLEARIDKAFTDALGDCQIYQDGGNFYVKKGTTSKKLGSSEGSATSEQVLAGATFNSKNTLDNEDYSTGTMPNRGAWTGATTGSGNVAIPKGYHNGNGYVSGSGAYSKGVTDADARVNTASANYKGGYNAGVSAGMNACVYDLGVGTYFDIRSRFPNDYARLTANNFIGGGRTESQRTDANGHNYSIATANNSFSYNNSTGILTVDTPSSDGFEATTGGYGLAFARSIPHVYLVLGRIN